MPESINSINAIYPDAVEVYRVKGIDLFLYIKGSNPKSNKIYQFIIIMLLLVITLGTIPIVFFLTTSYQPTFNMFASIFFYFIIFWLIKKISLHKSLLQKVSFNSNIPDQIIYSSNTYLIYFCKYLDNPIIRTIYRDNIEYIRYEYIANQSLNTTETNNSSIEYNTDKLIALYAYEFEDNKGNSKKHEIITLPSRLEYLIFELQKNLVDLGYPISGIIATPADDSQIIDTQEQNEISKICSNCKTINPPEALFCVECGSPLT